MSSFCFQISQLIARLCPKFVSESTSMKWISQVFLVALFIKAKYSIQLQRKHQSFTIIHHWLKEAFHCLENKIYGSQFYSLICCRWICCYRTTAGSRGVLVSFNWAHQERYYNIRPFLLFTTLSTFGSK